MQILRKREKFDALVRACHAFSSVTTAVVHPPCDEFSLAGALEAAAAGLITPVLSGPETRIREPAVSLTLNPTGHEIVDLPHGHSEVANGVELVRAGRADALTKGSLHTGELLTGAARKDTGIRTENRRQTIGAVLDGPLAFDTAINTCAASIQCDACTQHRDIGSRYHALRGLPFMAGHNISMNGARHMC
ncbi:hypothetical protein [Burkholderia seminalis]|uniref:Uncharacterized protein n=1 Tax=Burkholderia seminalis TaxID=488731 RepID=A0A8A8DE13_9BURK|nr:hypothetical protein [Burkholderia seminalis]QTO23345.1 hypothetical protein DT99_035375 [Burkholderia seminalis]